MIRPAANTPSRRGTRTSPVSEWTRTSANCAPKLCIPNWSAYGFSGISPVTSSPSAGTAPAWSDARRARSLPAASTIAVPQLVMPDEPPALQAMGSAVSPIRSWTSSTVTSRASAAIWVSAVQVPVPMSAAPIRTA
jgi:hypothetical protein